MIGWKVLEIVFHECAFDELMHQWNVSMTLKSQTEPILCYKYLNATSFTEEAFGECCK